MTPPVVWIPEAGADLNEALNWYEGKHPDLGRRFVLAVDAAVEAIPKGPLQFSTVHAEIRRAGVKRFPYGLFFKLESHRIVVLACMHGKRSPTRWQLREMSRRYF